MFFYLINIYNYTDTLCNNIEYITNYTIYSSNYTENKFLIDKYCYKKTEKCLIDKNASYFVSCHDYTVDDINRSCVLFVILCILINILLFIFYKGFMEEYIDHCCRYIWNRIISICFTVDKPSFRYISYNSL